MLLLKLIFGMLIVAVFAVAFIAILGTGIMGIKAINERNRYECDK